MIDYPHSLPIKPARTYSQEALLRGTWHISDEADGIEPELLLEVRWPDLETDEHVVACHTVPSHTTANLLYVLAELPGGVLICPCPARGRCKHQVECILARQEFEEWAALEAEWANAIVEMIGDAAPDFAVSEEEARDALRQERAAKAMADLYGEGEAA